MRRAWCNNLQIGRAFFRLYNTRGPGIKVWLHRNGVSVWLGRLMLEAHWLHRSDCECDDCVWESYMGITDPE